METSKQRVTVTRTHYGRAALPGYVPETDGIPVDDIDEVSEAAIGVFKFHGDIESVDADAGIWDIELPSAPYDDLFWREGNEEYTFSKVED